MEIENLRHKLRRPIAGVGGYPEQIAVSAYSSIDWWIDENVVVKEHRNLDDDNSNNKEANIYEYNILQELKDEDFIIKCLGFLTRNEEPEGIILEYMPNGSVAKFVYYKDNVKLDVIVKWMIQATKGLKNIHKHNIIHGDIKSSNFLLDEKFDVKLCDFHGSKVLSQGETGKK